MGNVENCLYCGGKMKSVSIGWKCEKCNALMNMKGVWYKSPNGTFIPDSVLEEQYDVKNQKYKKAIERMGNFGKLFVEYKGCPRGAVGRAGGMRIEEEAQLMSVIEDVDGGRWRPVQEDVLQDLISQLIYLKYR